MMKPAKMDTIDVLIRFLQDSGGFQSKLNERMKLAFDSVSNKFYWSVDAYLNSMQTASAGAQNGSNSSRQRRGGGYTSTDSSKSSHKNSSSSSSAAAAGMSNTHHLKMMFHNSNNKEKDV
jgi:hypothetical protein